MVQKLQVSIWNWEGMNVCNSISTSLCLATMCPQGSLQHCCLVGLYTVCSKDVLASGKKDVLVSQKINVLVSEIKTLMRLERKMFLPLEKMYRLTSGKEDVRTCLRKERCTYLPVVRKCTCLWTKNILDCQ